MSIGGFLLSRKRRRWLKTFSQSFCWFQTFSRKAEERRNLDLIESLKDISLISRIEKTEYLRLLMKWSNHDFIILKSIRVKTNLFCQHKCLPWVWVIAGGRRRRSRNNVSQIASFLIGASFGSTKSANISQQERIYYQKSNMPELRVMIL